MCVKVDQKKFLTVPEAAGAVRVSRMTMYRWALQGETANGEKLCVIKDRKTGHYYVAEKSVKKLQELYGPARFEVVFAG